jgi:hypothetical protein
LIAYYLQNPRPATLDRARAVMAALGPDTVLVSASAAPLGWRTPWVTTSGTDPVSSWKAWLADGEPTFVVVDGSAGHARAAACPGRTVAVVATPGGSVENGAGEVVLAPWAPVDRNRCSPPSAARIHLGAIGRAAAEAAAVLREVPRQTGRQWQCVVLSPPGGGLGPRERRDLLLDAPAWRWWFAAEHEVLEPHEPIWSSLARADVAVCAPTPANLAAVASAGTPTLLVLPDRPTSDQLFLADRAEQTGSAVVTTTPRSTAQWRTLLAHAQERGNGWGPWDPRPGLEELRLLVDDSASTSSNDVAGLTPA